MSENSFLNGLSPRWHNFLGIGSHPVLRLWVIFADLSDVRGSESVMHSVQTEAGFFHPAKEVDTGSPVFDLGHLQRYTLGDQALQSEVLGLFREQIASSLVVLRESIASDDSAAWRMAAHTLKGSAWAVGAFLLAEAAELAERDNATRESRSAGTERIARAAVMTVAAIS